MTTDDLQSFFQSGAFIRLSDTQWALGWGEVQLSKDSIQKQACFFVSDFFLENPSWVQFKNNELMTTSELQKLLEHNPGAPMRSMHEIAKLAQLGKLTTENKREDWSWSDANKEMFAESFITIKNQISELKLQKCVPLTYEMSSQSPGHKQIKLILHRLLSTPENSTPFGYWNNEKGIIGATPEKLFTLKEKKLSTMALAGTKQSKDENSLLNDEKESFEHQLVIDQITSLLKTWGHIKERATQEESFGALTHLKTKIECELEQELSVMEIIQAMHPTPALGGEPKARAIEILREQPASKQRSYYGAPFGYMSANGETEVLVAIRNIIWNSTQAYLFSGCGVVDKSELENEWKELSEKRKSVKSLLGV